MLKGRLRVYVREAVSPVLVTLRAHATGKTSRFKGAGYCLPASPRVLTCLVFAGQEWLDISRHPWGPSTGLHGCSTGVLLRRAR